MRIRLMLAIVAWMSAAQSPQAMTLQVIGNQLIMSGDVVGTEYSQAVALLSQNPGITTIVLRNSNGGNAPVSYRLGQYFRDHGFATAVSGYCVSSCSRLFLGGKERQFTDDYPPSVTEIWLHGHYDSAGNLNPNAMAALGLRAYLIRMSDGHADPSLIERWVNTPYNNGGIHFFHPGWMTWRRGSTFLCQGVPPVNPIKESILNCELIPKTAVDLGIVTSLELIHSNDQAALRKNWALPPPRTGFSPVTDQMELPFRNNPDAMQGFERFLTGQPPRAFAITSDGAHMRWTTGSVTDPREVVLNGCIERFHLPCMLFAVDGQIGRAALQSLR